MVKIVEAIYSGGLLRPVEALELPEQQRVRLTVQVIDGVECPDRAAALARLRAGIDAMDFRSGGRLPTRDELHDRS
jgi:predicted DNA-binding antitoxin AbrB/MazE fold protein